MVLKYGSPLTHLLFILDVEGLNRLFDRIVELYLFSSVRMGSSDLVISQLRYVYSPKIVKVCVCVPPTRAEGLRGPSNYIT